MWGNWPWQHSKMSKDFITTFSFTKQQLFPIETLKFKSKFKKSLVFAKLLHELPYIEMETVA